VAVVELSTDARQEQFSSRLTTHQCREKQNKFAWLSSCRCCTNRARNLPRPAPDNVLRVFRISSKSVCFRRSYSRTREWRDHRHAKRAVKWIQYSAGSLASSRIITQIRRLLAIASDLRWAEKCYEKQHLRQRRRRTPACMWHRPKFEVSKQVSKWV